MIHKRHPAVAELIIGSLQEGPNSPCLVCCPECCAGIRRCGRVCGAGVALAGGFAPRTSRTRTARARRSESGLAAQSSQSGRAPFSSRTPFATPHSHAPRHVEVTERSSCWHPVLSGTVIFLDSVRTTSLQGLASAAPLFAFALVQTQLSVWPSP